MKHSLSFRIAASILSLGVWALSSSGAEPGTLRAGAARVDVTPAADAALPLGGFSNRSHGFTGIHDDIYLRAIVLDDGTTQAALVGLEGLFFPDAVWAAVSSRVASELGIRPENLLLSAVHDHSAPTLSMGRPPGQAANTTTPAQPANAAAGGRGAYTPNPAQIAYTAKVVDDAVEAIRLAKSRLQPARFGIGTGTAYLNINRREPRNDGSLALGFNEKGPSDKTVTVLRFEDLTGKPIAFYINYAVHAVVLGSENYQITGDLAGATSRFVENHYAGKDHPRSDAGPRMTMRPENAVGGDGVVAVWTSGSAGDQNPSSMSSGETFGLVESMGQMLGEVVVRVAAGIKTAPQAKLWGMQEVVTCPGRRLEPGSNQQTGYKWTDSNPVNIRLSLLMLDHIAVTGVSGEVFTMINQHLKAESPFRNSVMITHTNGSSGYIPSDDAFDQVSYEITSSRLKPGCAENAIVNGFLDMMRHN
jgi:neutral ceramidase